jgi:adenylate cyclase
VLDAVLCSIDCQRGMIERNANVASERRVEFRMGINMATLSSIAATSMATA